MASRKKSWKVSPKAKAWAITDHDPPMIKELDVVKQLKDGRWICEETWYGPEEGPYCTVYEMEEDKLFETLDAAVEDATSRYEEDIYQNSASYAEHNRRFEEAWKSKHRG